MTEGKIQTVLSAINSSALGLTLPHEHLFTDLRGPNVIGYAKSQPGKVVKVMKPFLKEISDLGVRSLVECSTIGVGRNPIILKMLSEESGIHIIAPTGVYREAYVPAHLFEKSVGELSDLMIKDITCGIDGSNIKAGFIKMAVSDDGISEIEAKNLHAAVLASQQTGAVIASHTIGGKLAFEEMDLLQEFGLDLNRFIWTHAQSESDTSYHLEAAKRGAYVSIDAIGSGWVSDKDMLEYTINLIQAGFSEKILLSHDAGWFDPSQPSGHPAEGGIRGYTALFTTFLPALEKKVLNPDIIDLITTKNPSVAFCLQ